VRRPSGTEPAPRPRATGTSRGGVAPAGRPLPRAFYARPVLTVARAVLGRLLVADLPGGRTSGRIVEVEAYGGRRDPASHAFGGPTPRNQVMFGRAGHAYVYFTYGMHHCFNLVTGRAGRAEAVLVRALEPVDGIDRMRRRRGARATERLASGPGNLTRALGLTRDHDRCDLVRGSIWLSDLPPRRGKFRIVRGPRIGLRKGREAPWRFYLGGHPCVSAPRGGRPRRAVPG